MTTDENTHGKEMKEKIRELRSWRKAVLEKQEVGEAYHFVSYELLDWLKICEQKQNRIEKLKSLQYKDILGLHKHNKRMHKDCRIMQEALAEIVLDKFSTISQQKIAAQKPLSQLSSDYTNK